MPRMGLGIPIAAPMGRAPALSIVDNGVFEQIVSGEITPEFTTTRTNLALYSQDVSHATWTKSNVAVDGTAVEAPDDTTTAQVVTGAENTSTRKTSQTIAITAGLTYTYSAYVKAVAFSHVRLSINDGTVEHTQDFNITNASSGSAGAASNVLRSEIEKLDNNWFRVALTIQCQNTNTDAIVGTLSMAANNTPSVNVAVADTILMHVWGQQFEQDIQANAYIATAATTKTAAASLIDVNSVWDFDGTDLVVEADPDSEGFWDNNDTELVTNGTFDTDANWTKGTGWTISGGTASCDGSQSSQSNFFQSSVVPINTTYEVKFTATISAGGVTLAIGGSNAQTITTSSGTYTFISQATSGDAHLYFSANSTFVGSIDNVSVTEYAITPLDV